MYQIFLAHLNIEFYASNRATYEKFADGKEKDISDELPFDLPQSWVWVKLVNVSSAINSKSHQILESDIIPCGRFPVVSQGRNRIDGYCNQTDKVLSEVPVILFGDHTRVVKFIDYPFIVGADGTKLFKPLTNPKWLYYWTTYASTTSLQSRGYGRHWNLLNLIFIPLPPLVEQKRIVAKIEELFAYADKIGKVSDGIALTAQRLDKRILDLAIRGQLVPQDPNDEPASELIKRIEVAKKATEKGRKSSRAAASDRPAYEIEPPFDIPDSWEWVQLNDLGRFVGGHTPSIADSSNWENGNILWVTSKDMKQKYISNTGCMVTEKGASELHLLPPGSLLMVTRSGILRRTFPIALAAKPLTINQDQRALEFYDNNIGEYIYYCLKSLEPIVLRDYRKTGTTVESIIWEKFIHIPIPLPPINEQRRIVAKVEEFKAMISNLVNS